MQGIMRVLFQVGSAPGNYEPTFELIDGNAVKMTVTAAGPAPAQLPATGSAPARAWEPTIALAAALLSAGLLWRRRAFSRG